MPLFHGTASLPPFRKPVLTIGTFDGVHLGHRAILDEVVRHARRIGGESIVITFEPHPRKLLFPNEPLRLLTPLGQKADYLHEAGIDHVVVQPFDAGFSRLAAGAYVQDFLVRNFRPSAIVIGYDHHFGADRSGNIALLESLAPAAGFEVHQIPAQMIDAAAISSTKIRRGLDSGDVAGAAQMLGRPYALSGTVVEGAQLGRTIGYPTANILPADADQLVPARGVYAVLAQTEDGRLHQAMLNIGYRPTVAEGLALKIEAHLLGFSGNLYGQAMTITFIARLRDEQKFDSLDALKAQLGQDAVAAAAALVF